MVFHGWFESYQDKGPFQKLVQVEVVQAQVPDLGIVDQGPDEGAPHPVEVAEDQGGEEDLLQGEGGRLQVVGDGGGGEVGRVLAYEEEGGRGRGGDDGRPQGRAPPGLAGDRQEAEAVEAGPTAEGAEAGGRRPDQAAAAHHLEAGAIRMGRYHFLPSFFAEFNCQIKICYVRLLV